MKDFAQEFLWENCSINVKFLDNKTGNITAATYFLSITEIKSSIQQFGSGPLCIVRNYVLGLIWEND